MKYTIYKITNTVNNKIYIGKHKTEDINDNYMGSGLLIERAIEKYGVDHFTKDILFVYDNEQDASDMEAKIVDSEFIKRADTYNIKLGGTGGWDHVNANNLGVLIHNQKNYKEAQKLGHERGFAKIKELSETKEFKEYFSQRVSEGLQLAISEGRYTPTSHFTGMKHTEESKNKIGLANSKRQKGSGNSHYGTMWIYNLELKESKRIKKTDPIPNGWKKGRKLKF